MTLQVSGPSGTDAVAKTVTVAGGPGGGPSITTTQAHTSVIAAAAGGYAVVTTDTSGAACFASASVVDNRSGDPIYVPATGGGSE